MLNNRSSITCKFVATSKVKYKNIDHTMIANKFNLLKMERFTKSLQKYYTHTDLFLFNKFKI